MLRKPSLTKNIIDGLSSIEAAIEAGDLLQGDLSLDGLGHEDDSKVLAALEWIRQTYTWKYRTNLKKKALDVQ